MPGPTCSRPIGPKHSPGLQLAYSFAVDDNLHVREGEIHCGTNQVHTALAGARVRWWDVQPPP